MNEWEILQIEKTADLTIIRKAYASLIKKYKPHEHPEKFKQIRAAYEQIIESIEHGISLDNDDNKDSIFDIIEQNDCVLTNNVPNTLTESFEKNQVHETDQFYIADIMELYADLEKRNDIEAWHSVIQKNSTELLMDDDSFDFILEHIVKSEYLYHSDLPCNPEIYVLLFDFFNVDEVSYLSNRYSIYVSRPLLNMLSQHRHDLRLASIQKSAFNLNSPETQITAEDYYANEIFHSADLLQKNIEQLSTYFQKSSPVYCRVLGNVVFKDILDKHISSTMQNDGRLVGQFYNLFKFKNSKKIFFAVFIPMGYSKEDIESCLNFCKKMYVDYVQPSLWYRIVMSIPPLEIIFGLLCWVYIFIKKSYLMFFKKDDKQACN